MQNQGIPANSAENWGTPQSQTPAPAKKRFSPALITGGAGMFLIGAVLFKLLSGSKALQNDTAGDEQEFFTDEAPEDESDDEEEEQLKKAMQKMGSRGGKASRKKTEKKPNE